MASKQKSPSKPSWQLSFEVSPDVTLTADRQPCHRATAVARHGDLAYMAELELVNWAEDIAAFFSQARAVFTAGAPEFPNLAEDPPPAGPADTPETPAEAGLDEAPVSDDPAGEADTFAESEADFDVEYYPTEGSAEETDPAQPSLW